MARLQGTTKKYETDLIVSESVKDLTEDDFIFRSIDLVTVKGKSEPTELFTVLGRYGETLTPNWLGQYEYAVKMYRKGQFDEALESLERAETYRGEDGLIDLYRERCETLIENPPGSDWDPVVNLTEK